MTDQDKQSLAEIVDALPERERADLSAEFATWYNAQIAGYKKYFAIEEDPQRTFTSEDEVILFFREAILWWYRAKPKIADAITPLAALKTRACLGQIHSLKQKLDETGIPIKKLKINEHLGAAQ